jgi:tetratricopeptide (TPR) repeat protein
MNMNKHLISISILAIFFFAAQGYTQVHETQLQGTQVHGIQENQSQKANTLNAVQIKSFASVNQNTASIDSMLEKPVMQQRSEGVTNEESLNELGVQLIFQGEKEQGVHQLELAHQRDPKNAAVLYNLSGYYIAEKNYGSALSSIDKALEISPSDLHFLKRKTEALLPLRKFDEAITVYKKITQIDPDNGDSYGKLGALYGLKGNWQESESSLLHARNILGDTPAILNNLASARLMLKKYQQAIEVLEVAQQRWPTADREITLGVANEGLGNKQKAVTHYRNAKELGAANKHLDAHIERVSN